MQPNNTDSNVFELAREEFIRRIVEPTADAPLTDLECIRRAKLILLTSSSSFMKSKLKIQELERQFIDSHKEQPQATSKLLEKFPHLKKVSSQEELLCGSDRLPKGTHRMSLQTNFTFFHIAPKPADASPLHAAQSPVKNKAFQSLIQQQESRLQRADSETLDKANEAFKADEKLVFVRSFMGQVAAQVASPEDAFNPFNFFECKFQPSFNKQRQKANFIAKNMFEMNEFERVEDLFFSSHRSLGNLLKVQKREAKKFDIWIQKETNTQIDNFNFRFSLAFGTKRQESLEFRIMNLNVRLMKGCAQLEFFCRRNGQDWQREVRGVVEGRVLRFEFGRREEDEGVEFSLFPPFLIENVWNKIGKLQTGSRVLRALGKEKAAGRQKEKDTSEEQNSEEPLVQCTADEQPQPRKPVTKRLPAAELPM